MKKSLFLAIGLLIAHQSFADVKLSVDEHIKVTAINGQEIKHGALQPIKREFTLANGRHVITARYDRMFELTREHDYVKSGNITVTADLADGHYQLVMPNQPNNYQSAKEYAKSPSLAIVQQGNIISQSDTVAPSEGLLSGLGGLFNRGSAVHDNQKVIASINQPANKETNTSTQPPTTTKDNLDGFMQIWLNANEAEREKIRQWIQK